MVARDTGAAIPREVLLAHKATRTFAAMNLDTTEVIRRFNDAFQQHNPDALADLIAKDCVLENTSPAPDGERFETGAACVNFWQQLAADPGISFDLEDVIVTGDRAIILWRLHFGRGPQDSV